MREHRELTKIPKLGKISGVCAGIAKYFDFEVWVVRLTVIGVAIWTGFGAVILAYILASWLLNEENDLEAKSTFSTQNDKRRAESQKHEERYRMSARDVWKTAPAVDIQIDTVRKKFSDLEERIRKMEGYVTTKEFQLRRKFKNLQEN